MDLNFLPGKSAAIVDHRGPGKAQAVLALEESENKISIDTSPCSSIVFLIVCVAYKYLCTLLSYKGMCF